MSTETCFKKMFDYFKGDYDTTMNWFSTYHPGLCSSPALMIFNGRTDKLEMFIDCIVNGIYP